VICTWRRPNLFAQGVTTSLQAREVGVWRVDVEEAVHTFIRSHLELRHRVHMALPYAPILLLEKDEVCWSGGTNMPWISRERHQA
jgi:hypothetical protein